MDCVLFRFAPLQINFLTASPSFTMTLAPAVRAAMHGLRWRRRQSSDRARFVDRSCAS
jgi:hypothetical protein